MSSKLYIKVHQTLQKYENVNFLILVFWYFFIFAFFYIVDIQLNVFFEVVIVVGCKYMFETFLYIYHVFFFFCNIICRLCEYEYICKIFNLIILFIITTFTTITFKCFTMAAFNLVVIRKLITTLIATNYNHNVDLKRHFVRICLSVINDNFFVWIEIIFYFLKRVYIQNYPVNLFPNPFNFQFFH